MIGGEEVPPAEAVELEVAIIGQIVQEVGDAVEEVGLFGGGELFGVGWEELVTAGDVPVDGDGAVAGDLGDGEDWGFHLLTSLLASANFFDHRSWTGSDRREKNPRGSRRRAERRQKTRAMMASREKTPERPVRERTM